MASKQCTCHILLSSLCQSIFYHAQIQFFLLLTSKCNYSFFFLKRLDLSSGVFTNNFKFFYIVTKKELRILQIYKCSNGRRKREEKEQRTDQFLHHHPLCSKQQNGQLYHESLIWVKMSYKTEEKSRLEQQLLRCIVKILVKVFQHGLK